MGNGSGKNRYLASSPTQTYCGSCTRVWAFELEVNEGFPKLRSVKRGERGGGRREREREREGVCDNDEEYY